MANLVYMSKSRPIRVYTVKPLSRLGDGILKEEREREQTLNEIIFNRSAISS